MLYSKLGATGLSVSRLCVGMMSYGSPEWQKWVLGYERAEHFVRRALDAGINFFDSADFYSLGQSEEMLGRAVSRLVDRKSVVLTTKVGLPMSKDVNDRGLSRKHVLASIDRSLKRLNTDYIDLYFLHEMDPGTPIEESVDAMESLVKAGKVLYFGISNLPPWLAAKAHYYARYNGRAPVSCVQLQYNLCYREEERDALPLCAAERIGVMVYSPLARGWLAGNRVDAGDRPLSTADALRASSDAKAQALFGSAGDKAVLNAVRAVAEARGVPPARVAMAWILSNAQVSSMICGLLEDSHLDEAIAACDVALTADERTRLEQSYTPQWPKGTGLAAVLGGMAPQQAKVA